MSIKQKSAILLLLFAVALTFSACSSKKKCNTRNKKRVEMGWM